MADSDKNIRITTNKNKATLPPNIVFTGASAGTSVLTLEVRDDNSIAFTGTDGDVFSLDYNLSTGTIWSVNDKSGTPLLRASAGGTIGIAELGSGVLVGIGQTNPKYKLDVQGWVGFASTGDGTYTVLLENGLTTGNNALSIRAANALRFYNSGNTLYTAFIGAQSGVNTTYILPPTTPSSIGASFLTSTQSGTLAWISAPSGGGSGSVNSGTATYAAYYATTSTTVDGNANLQFTGTGVSVGGFINSSSTLTGSLYVRGGVGITGNAFIGGTVNITSSTVSIGTNSGALVVTGGVGIGGSLYTSSGSTSSVSGVLLQNANVSASSYNKVAITAPATSATLTLANNSTLATSGGFSLTLTTTAASNVTFPTAGTLITSGATSPDFLTSITTGSATFSVFNTNATNISAFGAATVLSIGANTGKATFNSTDNSTSTTTGSLVVSGGAGIAKSLSIGGSLNIFNGANYTGFKFAGSASTTYTLPPRTPTGTGTSYLSSSIDGVMAWVAAPTSGGGSPGGSSGEIQYNNGGAFGGISGLTYSDPNNGIHLVVNTPPDTITATYGMLNIGSAPFDGLSLGQWGGSIKGTIVAINAGNGFTGNYLDFKNYGVAGFAVSSNGAVTIGNNVWTLPVTSGSSGQVLTSNGSGQQASWTTVTGSSSSGGTVYAATVNQIAYYAATGNTVIGSSTFTNTISTGVVDINHTTESTSTTTGALVVDGGAGIAKSLYVGKTLQVGQNPNYNIPNVLASFTSTVNSYNQVVIANKSNGTSASADFVLNNDVSTDSTTYGNLGINSSTFSGSGALAFPSATYLSSTSAPLVLGTTTQHPIRFVVNGSATDMIYIDGAGTAISVFANLGLRSASDLRFWNSGNTFYAGLQGGASTVSYLLSMPTAPVAAGASAMIVGSDGQMYFVTPGAGIAFSNATNNLPTIRARRSITMQFAAGYTPAAAGPDTVILKIPDSSIDGVTDVTYVLREFDVRVETASAGTSRVQLEKFSGTGAFTLGGTGYSMIGGFGITLTGAGTYFTSTASFTAGALVTSNDKLRVNWTLLNATHANFSIQLTMQEV